jgi:hypothetical protein
VGVDRCGGAVDLVGKNSGSEVETLGDELFQIQYMFDLFSFYKNTK